MKRLVLIAYEMPPRWGPHALRIANICSYLGAAGWDLTAVGCSPWPGLEDSALGRMIPPSMQVVRIPQRDGGGFQTSLAWTLHAARAAARIATAKRVDVILSSAPQYISHMAGYLTSIWTGTPWVTDSGDPFAWHAGYRRSRVGRWGAEQIERLWARRARRIIAVTEGAANKYRATFPETIGKTFAIPLGYEPDNACRPLAEGEHERFRLAFAGSWHLEMTNGPKEFFKGVSLACDRDPVLASRLDVEIVSRIPAAGWMREVVPERHWHLFTFSGHIPDMQQLLRRLARASCLVVWGFKGGLQVPSKVYVYFGLRRPILALITDTRDELKAMIEKSNRGVTVPDDAPRIAEAVAGLYRLHSAARLRTTFSTDDLPQYTWRHLIGRMDVLLQDVIAQDGEARETTVAG